MRPVLIMGNRSFIRLVDRLVSDRGSDLLLPLTLLARSPDKVGLEVFLDPKPTSIWEEVGSGEDGLLHGYSVDRSAWRSLDVKASRDVLLVSVSVGSDFPFGFLEASLPKDIATVVLLSNATFSSSSTSFESHAFQSLLVFKRGMTCALFVLDGDPPLYDFVCRMTAVPGSDLCIAPSPLRDDTLSKGCGDRNPVVLEYTLGEIAP